MAEDLMKSEPATVERPAPIRFGPSRPHADRLHGVRGPFGLAYLALGIVLGGAIAGSVVLLERQPAAHAKTAHAAAFQATGVGQAALQEIARNVEQKYHQANGQPLVHVLARPSAPPELVTSSGLIPISAVVVHAFAIEDTKDVRVVDFTKGTYFVMCGTGASCSIPGTPSKARGALVDREAVELCLQTMRQLASIDTVLVFRPAAKGSKQKPFILLTRADLASELRNPVSATLPPVARLTPGSLLPQDASRIENIVNGHLFDLDTNNPFQQLPDQTVALEAYPAVQG